MDSILADEDLTVAGGDVNWQMTNHEGSVERIRKGSNGSERSIRYSAFGVATDAAGGDEQFSYTGREFDEGVGPNAGPWGTDPGGIYYMRARYYDPTVGRFLSQDPSGFSSGDVNLYRYAENNPVELTDRFGLQATSSLGFNSATPWSSPFGSASLSTLDMSRRTSHEAFFAREQSRLANELQSAGVAMGRDAFQQEFVAQPEMMLPLDVTPVRRGDDFFAMQIDRKVREMYGDGPTRHTVPLTPMHGERLLAEREYIATDNRRMAIEALGYNSVNYTRADRIRLDREAWRNSEGVLGAFSYSVYMNARFLNDNEHTGTGTAGQEAMRASQDFLIDKSMIALDAAGVIGAARAANVAQKLSAANARLNVLEPHFVPDGRRVLQNLTTQTNLEFGANLSMARSVLSRDEITAALNPGVARMQYGNALERLVGGRIGKDPMLDSIFQWNENLPGPDFFGRGHLQGQIYDITTPGQVRTHLSRPYGQGLNVITYERPAGFP